MSSALQTLIAACGSKVCAPPPVGTGGSVGKSSGSARYEGGYAATAIGAYQESKSRLHALVRLGTDVPAYDAWASYTNVGYHEINQMLRRGVKSDPDIGGMHRAFAAAAVPLLKGATLHRGMTVDLSGDLDRLGYEGAVANLTKRYAPGTVFEDKAYVSTSTRRGQAIPFVTSNLDSFSDRSRGRVSFPTLVTIRASKGTRVLAGEEREQELILNAGTRFRVVKSEIRPTPVVRGGGKMDVLHIEVEVVK